MSIKTIIFDFGNVLYQTPDFERLKRWNKVLGLRDDPEISAILANPNESAFMNRIFLGEIPEDTIWQLMTEKWNMSPKLLKKFKKNITSKRKLKRPMVKLLAELHQHYQTGILSNAGTQTRGLMVDVLGLDKLVEDIVISAEEGVSKPDPAIFQIALERLNASAETSLFLDDYLPNVEAARALGMIAVHFIDDRQATREIRSILAEGA